MLFVYLRTYDTNLANYLCDHYASLIVKYKNK